MNIDSSMTRQCYSSGTAWEAATGYSRAVRVANQIYVAGTVAADEHGSIHGAGCYEQCCYIFGKLQAALQAVGSSLEDTVRTVAYLTDLSDAEDFCRAHAQFLGTAKPAATCVAVQG